MDRYHADLDGPAKIGHQTAFVGSLIYGVSQSMNFLVNALAFWYGGKLIIRGEYDINRMFTVFMAIIFGSMSAGRAFAFAPDLSKAKESARIIFSLLDRRPEIDTLDPSGKQLEISAVKGHIEFCNVKFRYPTRKNVKVLRGVDVEAKPGQTIALVGQSGCGTFSKTIYYDIIVDRKINYHSIT